MGRDEYLTRAREFARRGVELPHAKLTEDDVRMIRRNYPNWTAKQWAAQLGVHHRTIEKIRSFETWAHV